MLQLVPCITKLACLAAMTAENSKSIAFGNPETSNGRLVLVAASHLNITHQSLLRLVVVVSYPALREKTERNKNSAGRGTEEALRGTKSSLKSYGVSSVVTAHLEQESKAQLV